VVKNGKKQSGGKSIQRKRFNERSGTPIARLRTPVETIAIAMKMRSEGLGIRATGRVIGKSGSSITNWEQRISSQPSKWSPKAPARGEVTIEGDKVYTRVSENLPPPAMSEGWTIHFALTGNSILD
jgi:hypothetical protein